MLRKLWSAVAVILVTLGGMDAIWSIADRLGVKGIPDLPIPVLFDVARLAALPVGLLLLLIIVRRDATELDALRRRIAELGAGVATDEARAQVPRPSTWLPDPDSILSLTMTNADLDDCQRRALEYARVRLGPDAGVHFNQMTVGQTVAVEFWAWSKYAGQVTQVFVSEDGITDNGARQGAPWLGEDGDDWDFDPGPPPWQRDHRWRSLLDRVWYRIRPFRGSLELEAVAFGDEGWRITATPSDGNAANVVWFETRGDDVVERRYRSALESGDIVERQLP